MQWLTHKSRKHSSTLGLPIVVVANLWRYLSVWRTRCFTCSCGTSEFRIWGSGVLFGTSQNRALKLAKTGHKWPKMAYITVKLHVQGILPIFNIFLIKIKNYLFLTAFLPLPPLNTALFCGFTEAQIIFWRPYFCIEFRQLLFVRRRLTLRL